MNRIGNLLTRHLPRFGRAMLVIALATSWLTADALGEVKQDDAILVQKPNVTTKLKNGLRVVNCHPNFPHLDRNTRRFPS